MKNSCDVSSSSFSAKIALNLSHQTILHSRIGVILGDHNPLDHTHKDCNTQGNMVGVTGEENSISTVLTHCDCTMEPNVCYSTVGTRSSDDGHTLHECDTTTNVCYGMATTGNPAETQEESEGSYTEITATGN